MRRYKPYCVAVALFIVLILTMVGCNIGTGGNYDTSELKVQLDSCRLADTTSFVKSNGERYWSNEFAGYPKGYLYFVSETGFTQSSSPAYYIEYYYRDLQLNSISRNTAIPVRCVKDDPDEIARRKNLEGEE